MTAHSPKPRLSSFLLNLECLNMDGQIEAFQHEITETGGSWFVIDPSVGCPRAYYEISLHGVYAFGETSENAIGLWKKAARAVLDWLEENDSTAKVRPPFPNPRNHAEEIANARAATGYLQ